MEGKFPSSEETYLIQRIKGNRYPKNFESKSLVAGSFVVHHHDFDFDFEQNLLDRSLKILLRGDLRIFQSIGLETIV